MQITAFCFNWDEVRKRTSTEQIVEEMIRTDDIDIYAEELPDEIWTSDSAIQHHHTAEVLAKALKRTPDSNALRDIASLISVGDSVDELGISALTEGCYFISISPARVQSLLKSFLQLDLETIPGITEDAAEWLRQWKFALEFAQSKCFGIIGHRG